MHQSIFRTGADFSIPKENIPAPIGLQGYRVLSVRNGCFGSGQHAQGEWRALGPHGYCHVRTSWMGTIS